MASGTDSMVNEFLKYGGYEEDCENRFWKKEEYIAMKGKL
jgi:hypothetical protein